MKVYTFNEDERERAARQFLSLDDSVLVTQDGNMYDVIYRYYGCFEYTKMKLDFEDAREVITLHNYPVIFCGVELEELIQAPSDINEPREDVAEPFFVDDVDSVLKITVEDLENVFKATNIGNLDITKKFVEKLNIRQLGEYDKKQMTDVSSFLTEFSERERCRIDTIKEFRNLLADSVFNRGVLDSFSINSREVIKKWQQKTLL